MNRIYFPKKVHISDLNDDVSDTGQCNRLLLWDLIQRINKRSGYQHILYLDEKTHPERHLIDLPNTKYFTDIPEEIDSILSFEEYKKIDETGDIFPEKSFLIDFGVEKIEYHMSVGNYNNVFSEVNLKDQEKSNYIKNEAQNYFGIHIRRFNGVKFDETSLLQIPKDQRMKYLKLQQRKEKLDCLLPFTGDNFYFELIDKILEKDENIKFYISHDLPDHFLDYYKKRYGKNIYTRTDFYDKFPYMNTLERLTFDLFFLANTPFQISSDGSSWSYFTEEYKKDKTFFYPFTDINKIIETFFLTLTK